MSKIANSIGSIVLGGIGALSLPACGDRAPEHELQAFEDRTLPAFRNVAEVAWALEHDIGPSHSRNDMLKNSTSPEGRRIILEEYLPRVRGNIVELSLRLDEFESSIRKLDIEPEPGRK